MAELAESDQADDCSLQRAHLLEPVRASLVVATHTIADACVEASKSGNTIEMRWPGQFERLFKQEIELLVVGWTITREWQDHTQT